jgi:hypothetical protein
MNGAIGLINGAINVMNKIPKVNVPQIKKLSLGRMAKGGIVDRPIIAEIGEAGREAVIPLENNKGWIKQLAGDIKTAMASANGNEVKGYTYGEMVTAFKDALGQMKVELDSENMGAFVEKTIADAIYI